MQVKFVGDEEYVFCYGERGQRSEDRTSILFVHGFTSSKDQWNTAFKVKAVRSACYHCVAAFQSPVVVEFLRSGGEFATINVDCTTNDVSVSVIFLY